MAGATSPGQPQTEGPGASTWPHSASVHTSPSLLPSHPFVPSFIPCWSLNPAPDPEPFFVSSGVRLTGFIVSLGSFRCVTLGRHSMAESLGSLTRNAGQLSSCPSPSPRPRGDPHRCRLVLGSGAVSSRSDDVGERPIQPRGA